VTLIFDSQSPYNGLNEFPHQQGDLDPGLSFDPADHVDGERPTDIMTTAVIIRHPFWRE
jgi:hypothetical protein